MRVFVTGATGFIGRAVVKELLNAGHQVLGLARSDQSAEYLVAAGAEVQRGSLDDLESLKQGAAASDGVIHLAFIHDFSDYAGSCSKDRTAIEAIGDVLTGTSRPFVITSGTLLLPQGQLCTEDTPPDLKGPGAVRGATEQVALSFVSKGVRVSIIRLPPTNHGKGDHGFIAELARVAKSTGVSAYLGNGLNRWPTTHRLDTAKTYLLALEKAAAGSVFHAVAEEGIPIKEIAEALGKQLSIPSVSKTAEHFGWLAIAIGGDNPTTSAKTREQLGWSPVHASLISEIEAGIYTSG
ncbi:alcohol dehydrogenase [Exophiala aquamarina CBS 119918]|uniref:Alcohol dehydrogenase n=1 Tax=Exophiala aquamarina CBS 119918 TaxID=1182545 RepID=A0A072PJU0_9EURO|nr:alcohol dehydrogenase [Exophiala aquamarina CBS 119918]KEF60032.1 alcohol dehydrogenase [Exophiala aquamarina CBS 119918]